MHYINVFPNCSSTSLFDQEILVMSPKLSGRLPTIAEELYGEADSDTQVRLLHIFHCV